MTSGGCGVDDVYEVPTNNITITNATFSNVIIIIFTINFESCAFLSP